MPRMSGNPLLKISERNKEIGLPTSERQTATVTQTPLIVSIVIALRKEKHSPSI